MEFAATLNLKDYPNAREICKKAIHYHVEGELNEILNEIQNELLEDPTKTAFVHEGEILKQTVAALKALDYDVQKMQENKYMINWGMYYEDMKDEDLVFEVSVVKHTK